MKTKFFRKLSFVLVVAMVLSLFVPAAGAFAAAKPKLNSTNKYLHLGVAKKDEFNFNIANKQKGWKYYWESADEDVAEVNEKNGVTTAVGVGKTKITCEITDADGEEVAVLEATVTVRDNIKEVKISNPVEGTLAVGATHDFNRSFVTVSGSTKKTSAITRWEVDSDNATIDDKGVFVATEAGEYTVTARSFQSKARYTAWQAEPEKYADYVLATDETKVVVAGSMVEAKQVDLNTFTVTFDSPMVKEDLEKDLKLSYIAGNTKVNHLIKGVSLDDTSKVATVDVYNDFVKEATYVVDYPKMESVQFIAASTKVSDVVRVEILTKTAQIAEEEVIEVGLYNANGVNIGADPDLKSRVELKTSSNATYLDSTNWKLYMYKVGDSTTITAIFHTYEYNEDGTEKGAVTGEGIVYCVEKKTADAGLLNAYTVVTGNPNFGDVKHTIAAGDQGYYLYVQLKGKDKDGNDMYTESNPAIDDGFKFTSSNIGTLIINNETGQIYPVKEGTASVVVSYHGTVVGAATITVIGARRATKITVSSQGFTLSNDDDVLDTKTVTVDVKDQLDDNYGAVTITTETVNGVAVQGVNDNGDNYELLQSGASGDTIVFGGANVPKGTYTYKVSVYDNNHYTTSVRYIYVTVAEPSSDDVVHHYALETPKTEYDMGINWWDYWGEHYKEDVVVSLFGYAANGVRNVRVNLDGDGFEVKITDPWNGTHTADGAGNWTGAFAKPVAGELKNGIMSLVSVDTSNVVQTLPTGTYRLNAVDASGKAVSATYFVVKNTQAAPQYTIKKYQSDETDILAAIKDCFKLSIGDTEFNNYDIGDVDFEHVVYATEKTIFVKSITVYQKIFEAADATDPTLVKHKVDINTVISFK